MNGDTAEDIGEKLLAKDYWAAFGVHRKRFAVRGAVGHFHVDVDDAKSGNYVLCDNIRSRGEAELIAEALNTLADMANMLVRPKGQATRNK